MLTLPHVVLSVVVAATNLGMQERPLATRVWVNAETGVYHCPNSTLYGKTVEGEFMSEAQARGSGHRAARRNGCNGMRSPRRAPLPKADDGSGAMVWVNTESDIYHCRGSQDFGTSKRGRYMREPDALAASYRAAAGRSCAK